MRLALAAIGLAMLAAGGCAASNESGAPRADATSTVGLEKDEVDRSVPVIPPEPVLPSELNSPRYAAMAVSTMPEPSDPYIVREIALHTSLFAFAIDLARGLVGQDVTMVLLPSGSTPRGIEPVEFQLRVLASLDDRNGTIRWARPIDRNQSGLAMLGFRVDSRQDADATLYAEVTCSSRRSAGQRVQAVWDGESWLITPAGVLSEW